VLGYISWANIICCRKDIKLNMKEKLTKAKYIEWQASLWGTCTIAFGLGMLLSSYLQQFVYILILIGIIMHAWGMYKIHKRNKE